MAAAAPDSGTPAQSTVNAAMQRMVERFSAAIREDLAADRMPWPSIPAVIVKVRTIMEKPNAKVSDITKAVSVDPALATRLMRWANSAYYGGTTPCNTLRGAVVRLGNDAVQHAVMILTVARVFNIGKRRKIQPHLTRLWKHSTKVAALSDVLARPFPELDEDVAMLGGLIHDIGVLPVIVHAQKYPSVLSKPSILDPLLATLHPELGRLMLEQWSFPEELVAVASEHENLTRDSGASPDYVDLVLVANQLSEIDPDEPPIDSKLWSLPAFKKLDVTAERLRELHEAAWEKSEALRELLQAK